MAADFKPLSVTSEQLEAELEGIPTEECLDCGDLVIMRKCRNCDEVFCPNCFREEYSRGTMAYCIDCRYQRENFHERGLAGL